MGEINPRVKTHEPRAWRHDAAPRRLYGLCAELGTPNRSRSWTEISHETCHNWEENPVPTHPYMRGAVSTRRGALRRCWERPRPSWRLAIEARAQKKNGRILPSPPRGGPPGKQCRSIARVIVPIQGARRRPATSTLRKGRSAEVGAEGVELAG